MFIHKLLFLFIFFFSFLTAPSSKVIDRLVAIVNDEIITQSELRESQKNLNDIIEEKLTQQLIKKLDLSAGPEEVTVQINSILKTQGLTQAQLIGFLKQRGLSYKQYRKNIKHGIEQQKLLEKEIKSSIVIKKEDVRAYYYNSVKNRSSKKRYHLRQLFFPVEISSEKTEKLKIARQAYSGYKKGISFEELLNTYSSDEAAKESKGDLGFLEEADLSAPFKKVLQALPQKTLSAPFETPVGIHLIETLEVSSVGGKSFEEAKDEIQKTLYEKEFQRVFNQWLKAKKEEAYIKILLPSAPHP
ncbi:MAG: peptidylprolyl isomerase [Deltaproteobacteria bacterium]|nr:peptidylprolyl isomerase [Deltaproteobacteria bacterium]